MKKLEFGQRPGILANSAVVAGMHFLIVPIREDRDYATATKQIQTVVSL